MIIKPLISCLRPHFINAFSKLRYSSKLVPQPKMLTDRIVWIDLEMTGLNVEKDSILEIACCISDFSLNDVIKGPNIAIKTTEEELQAMTEWCIKQHGKSGLTDLCRQSSITLPQAEEAVLNFVKDHVPPGVAPLGGNSVYADRLFLIKYMPTLNEYMHYRIIDVSSIREVIKRWAPLVAKNAPEKSHGHRASEDIMESINELKHYGTSIFGLS